jgi:hypothetical protein
MDYTTGYLFDVPSVTETLNDFMLRASTNLAVTRLLEPLSAHNHLSE